MRISGSHKVMNTHTHTQNNFEKLPNRSICVDTDQTQLPVKCYARLGSGVRSEDNVRSLPKSLPQPPPFISAHSSMLMSSSVQPDEAPPSFLTLICSCAGQLAVTFDLFALTRDPLDPFPRHTLLSGPRHGNASAAAATVTDGQSPGNNSVQTWSGGQSALDAHQSHTHTHIHSNTGLRVM